MRKQIITKEPGLVIRRLILEPGEARRWHSDPCRRFTVVVCGDELSIEFRDTGEQVTIPVTAGAADWDEPEPRVHRGINVGRTRYEEVVLFFLATPGADPQPEASASVQQSGSA